ncbi:MAG: aminotransferase class III-fold pyridoxal phosphate-dependent enzyme [Oligoflexia bacterium]|nr:aminotransferase class III-fold pyridoxal phosphate-dependent enzyme [Oligoflexia bacterium]
MKINLINNEDKKFAQENLSKFYDNNLIPAEKKEYLTDHKGSKGPYMGIASSNGETHYLMDAASQIATLGLGFNSPVFMGTTQLQSSWTNNKNDPTFKQLREAFENFIKREIGSEKTTITFCNSGAESNETALGYCYARRFEKSANKVLAFKGSFHGRMLVSLSATWNPSKREPFEWDGYKAVYCEYPELEDAKTNLTFPQDWRETWDNASANDFSINDNWLNDPTLKNETDCLMEVREKLAKKDIFAVIIEPMQCEGGDRYSSDRFHTALILLARAFNVPVINDEVQTGFHLGREFFWHRQLNMRDVDGSQLYPDYVVCAKKAQIGMVIAPHGITKNKIEQRESFQVASAIRGYLHAMALKQSRSKILHIESDVTKRLDNLTQKYKEFLSRPRACGVSFAMDLNDKDNVAKFIAKRFDHGLLYYPAGDKTLRFRLNTAFNSGDLDFLFERLDAICSDLFLNKQTEIPSTVTTVDRNTENEYKWQELLLKLKLEESSSSDITNTLNEVAGIFELSTEEKLIIIDGANFSDWKEQVNRLQTEVYEPTRQTSIERFETSAKSPYGINLAVVKGNELLAMAFSSSLQDHPLERGVRRSSSFNDPKSLYVIDTTVAKSSRGRNLGAKLKSALTILACAKGYNSIQGRNRDQLAGRMLHINLALGSFESHYIKEDYPDFEEHRDVVFYSTPLRWNKEEINLSSRKDSPLSCEDLDKEYLHEEVPYLTNKVCLSNFVNTKFLSNVKDILNSIPASLQHGFTTSGQSECVDKLTKTIWVERKKGPKSISFKGHYFGSGSFLSRSLTDSEDNYFPVEHLDHPTKENIDQIIKNIESQKADDVLGIWLEPVRQLDMITIERDVLKKLKEAAKKAGIPIIYNETASQAHNYSLDHYYASNDPELTPNAGMVFLGGQGGLVFCDDNLFLGKPLMMISTWDGDEYSFSAYKRNLDKISANKNDYLADKKAFHEKVTTILNNYPVEDLQINNGTGSFRGKLPKKLSQYFDQVDGRYIIDPNWSMMKKFLAL